MSSVSVIMSVFDESKEAIERAVDSVRVQKKIDIRLIVVVDNPELDSDIVKYLEAQADVLLINTMNLGLSKSLNRAISAVDTPFCARMDSDDKCIGERFSLQLDYLQESGADLVGSAIEVVGENGEYFGVRCLPQHLNIIKRVMKYSTAAFHPTWFARAEVFKNVMYNPSLRAGQDFDFLSRAILKGFSISNSERVLLSYTRSLKSTSFKKALHQYLVHMSACFAYEKSDSIEEYDVCFSEKLTELTSRSSSEQRMFSKFTSALGDKELSTLSKFLKVMSCLIGSSLVRHRFRSMLCFALYSKVYKLK